MGSSLLWISGEQTGIFLIEYGLRKLVNIQETHFPDLGILHANKEEVMQKCQKVCLNKQGGPEQTQKKKPFI